MNAKMQLADLSATTIVRRGKPLPVRKFKYVSGYLFNGITAYRANITSLNWAKCSFNERELAKEVDLQLIKNRKAPVNILKPKLK